MEKIAHFKALKQKQKQGGHGTIFKHSHTGERKTN